ncbi:MAG: hypothetical protein BRD55_10060 [Bacteroidetes bacterium SW_9_63_38]|nr:MAG: hypothetical protein BRD55_10060 [Bacteroidetes bacterium SW_9_63_38]
MTAPLFERLRTHAADGGIDTDELSLTVTEGTYRLSVAGDEHAGLDEDELQAVLAEYPDYLEEWGFWQTRAPQAPARWAFLRWVEEADDAAPPARRRALVDGVSQTWGQLHLTVRLDEEARRTYTLRHVDDADTPDERLDAHTDPLDARWIAKHDDDGRYRPLKTAPTLQTGWHFSGLNAAAAVQTIDLFYPATIANRYREQHGDLDVTHWAETTERQTGIYAVTEELEGEAVDWVAEACCEDSQCLKRREWDEDEDRELSVPRGDGRFPCREPCSLVIAAARKWTMLEREEEQAYTLHLTPSEKEQLETLLRAVAEGTAGTVREADVREGANRYRTRFLRAKRTDQHGRLDADDE